MNIHFKTPSNDKEYLKDYCVNCDEDQLEQFAEDEEELKQVLSSAGICKDCNENNKY